MRLGQHILPNTEEQYLKALGRTAEDPETYVILDTSILGYLYKLHAAARKDFFNWTTELELTFGRLFIPAWAAHEYLAKFKAGKFSDYAPAGPTQLTNSLTTLRETAASFVDGDILNKIAYKGSREDFLEGFDKAIEELGSFTCVFNQQFDIWSIHGEIATTLSNCILDSDLADLCARASSVGDARNSHRLPPGFRDSGKSENKYGDLIIWFEILSLGQKKGFIHSATEEKKPRDLIFVTNDEKADWVYGPTKRLIEIKGEKKEVPNREPVLKLADPRLVAEFQATVGHDKIHIVTLPILVKALSTIRPKGLENLASAIQIEDKVSKAREAEVTTQGAPADEESGATGTTEKLKHAAEPVLDATRPTPLEENDSTVAGFVYEYPLDALRDSAYELDESDSIDAAIKALKSHNWYVQNPAVQNIKKFRDAGMEPRKWFVLGRNIYQAACGNAQKALEFMKNLDIELARFPQQTAIHLLSGMLYEIYFNSDGEFRRTPKAAHIEEIMKAAMKAEFKPSCDFITSKLNNHENNIVFKPGSADCLPLFIKITEEQSEDDGKIKQTFVLQSVEFFGKERITMEDQIDAFFRSGLSRTTIDQIKSELSNSYAVPEWAIDVQLNLPQYANKMLLIPVGKLLNLSR